MVCDCNCSRKVEKRENLGDRRDYAKKKKELRRKFERKTVLIVFISAEEAEKLLDPSIAKLRSKRTENGYKFYNAIERYDDNPMKLYTDSSLKLNEGCVCSIANSRCSQVIYIRTENKNSTQAEYEGILRALVVI